ncbi:MAG: LLM class flavin-dependent oxidoreductase, partial [Nitrososphaerales archaeon]
EGNRPISLATVPAWGAFEQGQRERLDVTRRQLQYVLSVTAPDGSAPASDFRAPVPFARGSVSIRLYPHTELAADAIVTELCEQARLALQGGFDGVMISEHHGGFGGYLPNPLQMSTFVLEENPVGWAAACPLLLPLRPTPLVAEEVAWLNARHPGRVGLGVASGALPLDFEAMGLSMADSVSRFKNELPQLVTMLRGEGLEPLQADPALRACLARPVPVLSAAVSVGAARRAARCGAGILMEGMSSVERLARLTTEYEEAGGTASRVLIRRVWLGELQSEEIRRQRKVYNSFTETGGGFGDDQTVSCQRPSEMAEQLNLLMEQSGADALNLRVHLPGLPIEAVRGQIAAIGADVVGPLKSRGIGPVDRI